MGASTGVSAIPRSEMLLPLLWGPPPELIDIYLAGVPTERLLDEVTCGDMNIEGVKIVVSRERFPAVLEKLKMTKRNPGVAFDQVST